LGEALLSAKAGSKRQVASELATHLPQRLATTWLVEQRMDPALPLPQARDRDLLALAQSLHEWSVVPNGSEGWRKAEVTAGGVDTRELSSQTFESSLQPGLHFIGEVVDVTGWLGGYNFQWAWASGAACARALPAA
jgi:predicted Rossmann fold flavoprotein